MYIIKSWWKLFKLSFTEKRGIMNSLPNVFLPSTEIALKLFFTRDMLLLSLCFAYTGTFIYLISYCSLIKYNYMYSIGSSANNFIVIKRYGSDFLFKCRIGHGTLNDSHNYIFSSSSSSKSNELHKSRKWWYVKNRYTVHVLQALMVILRSPHQYWCPLLIELVFGLEINRENDVSFALVVKVQINK